MKRIGLLFFILICFSACGNAEVKSIDCDKMNEKLDNGAVLIDVRSNSEYDLEHLNGAINIPYDVIGSNLDDIPKDKEIIVYCQSGNRSSKAAKTLIDAGYKNVYDLGGIGNCKK